MLVAIYMDSDLGGSDFFREVDIVLQELTVGLVHFNKCQDSDGTTWYFFSDKPITKKMMADEISKDV